MPFLRSELMEYGASAVSDSCWP